MEADSGVSRTHVERGGLPRSWYIDQAIWTAESDAIFSKSWLYAGHVCALPSPGSYLTTMVNGQPVAVVRDRDGNLRAYHNVCSHRGHVLLDGDGCTAAIRCPYHAWVYELDGRLRTGHATRDLDPREAGLKPVRIETLAGLIFINLDAGAEDLSALVPDLDALIREHCPDPESLHLAASRRYDVGANWKLGMENFAECYHCPGTHPELLKVIDHGRYSIEDRGFYSMHRVPEPKANGQGSYVGFALWPNTTIGIYPGSRNLIVLQFDPAAPDRMIERCDFYLSAPVPDSSEEDAIAYVDDVLQPQDIALVEGVQRGLASRGFDQGYLVHNPDKAGLSEHSVAHFRSLVRACVSSAIP